MIQLNNQHNWVSAADSYTNEFLHVRLFPTHTITLAKQVLQELPKKHDADDAVYFVVDSLWLQAVLFKGNLRFQHTTHGNRNAVNRIFKKKNEMNSSLTISAIPQ